MFKKCCEGQKTKMISKLKYIRFDVDSIAIYNDIQLTGSSLKRLEI